MDIDDEDEGETIRLESLYLPIGSCLAPQMHNLDTSDATYLLCCYTRLLCLAPAGTPTHTSAEPATIFSYSSCFQSFRPVPTLKETCFVILASWTGQEHLIHNCTTAVGYMRFDRVVLWKIATSYSLPFDVLQTALYNKQWTNTTEISLRRRLRLETPLPSSSDDTQCQPQFAPEDIPTTPTQDLQNDKIEGKCSTPSTVDSLQDKIHSSHPYFGHTIPEFFARFSDRLSDS
ncbi:hypothetical protein M405DRAFT_590138 [Rhizopogon salebrosus TDB-379]|nr:hypothetical protein M405DRAFT_590138 [Rhizopogon salebrosus TDB-379]